MTMALWIAGSIYAAGCVLCILAFLSMAPRRSGVVSFIGFVTGAVVCMLAWPVIALAALVFVLGE